jgi:hypothetical protein
VDGGGGEVGEGRKEGWDPARSCGGRESGEGGERVGCAEGDVFVEA